MGDTIPIQGLTEGELRAALRRALDSSAPVRAVCDFVSSVDWSGLDRADAEAVSMLGELEQLTSDVSELTIQPSTFLDRVSRFTPAKGAEANT